MSDPGVDDVVADVEALGEFVDADLVVVQRGRVGDAVVPAQPADVVFVERAAARGQLAGLVELLGELRVGVRRAEFAQQVGDLGGAGARGLGSQDRELVAGAGAPGDADLDLGPVGRRRSA